VAVNSEYRALLRLWCNAEADEKALRSQVTRFLLALRRDCGQSTFGLEGETWSADDEIPRQKFSLEASDRDQFEKYSELITSSRELWGSAVYL
jgi:hypothetical protein